MSLSLPIYLLGSSYYLHVGADSKLSHRAD